ncbi:hypothetical protein [Streptomyces sp. NPDC094049]|uniref:hypothetical protein n=1 Tax=Streptomyces sp. NPDC094049 TaxID=3154987 RepID=UPI0033173F9D
MGTLGEGDLEAMIEEATVDAYGEDEQRTGLFTMLEEHLDLPFDTEDLGVEVAVSGVDLTPDGRIVALCSRGRLRHGRLSAPDLPLFELPRDLADADTVGVIYGEVDGLNFYADYGMLRDLFADPALPGRRQHQDLLRTYLREESITPLPIRRLATAHPETTDAVFRKLLRRPGFTWGEHGEALLRRRKPWYYRNEPRPGVSVISERLSKLTAGLQ